MAHLDRAMLRNMHFVRVCGWVGVGWGAHLELAVLVRHHQAEIAIAVQVARVQAGPHGTNAGDGVIPAQHACLMGTHAYGGVCTQMMLVAPGYCDLPLYTQCSRLTLNRPSTKNGELGQQWIAEVLCVASHARPDPVITHQASSHTVFACAAVYVPPPSILFIESPASSDSIALPLSGPRTGLSVDCLRDLD